MKRSKLLLPLLSGLSVVPALTICSCGETKSEAQKVADAIINPTLITEKTKISSLSDELKKLSSDDLKKELIYDIFGLFNVKGKYNLKAEDSFTSLYKENKVVIQSNITKCGLEFNKDGKLICYFLGYTSFVFSADYSDTYKENDYVMLTYDIQNQQVLLDEENCSLRYLITDTTFKENPCIGFAKIRYAGGKEVMQYISTLTTNTYDVKNSHNWTK